MKVELFVAGRPVSGNHMYRMRKRGRDAGHIYIGLDTIQWEHDVKMKVLEALGTKRLREPIAVSYRFVGMPGDASNYIKTTEDGIKYALQVDDRHFQIAGASIERAGIPGVFLVIEGEVA